MTVDDALQHVEDALDRRLLKVGVVTEGVVRGWPKPKRKGGKGIK